VRGCFLDAIGRTGAPGKSISQDFSILGNFFPDTLGCVNRLEPDPVLLVHEHTDFALNLSSVFFLIATD
jgi:hypothetical protein